MIKPEELYEKTKIPADEKILDSLLSYYLRIPFSELNRSDWSIKFYEMGNEHSILSSEMYNQINAFKKVQVDENKVDQEKRMLIAKVHQDFINAGSPFDPALHGGKTKPLDVQYGWKTFKSWNLLGTIRIHNKDQVHRFYLPVTSNDKYDFANELYDEFKRANIPFYFKVEESLEDRPDKIVIYTSSDLISKTMSVIGNIEKKRPDLIQNFSELSAVVGKVTDKIGYASEQPNMKFSYTQIICDSFSNAIEELTNEYMAKSIPVSIKNIYSQKLKEMESLGYKLEVSGKKRIASEVLLKCDSDFKKKLLEKFKEHLSKNDIDLNNTCFNNNAKDKLNDYLKIDIFDPRIQSKVITLPNGKKMTIAEYFIFNNLAYWVPPEAKVTFRNGRTISGKEFLSEAINRLEEFNTWEELILHYGIMIERHPNISQAKKQEESQAKIFDENEGKNREKEYQQKIKQIHEQLLLENMAKQQFSLEEQRKQIEEQMVSKSFESGKNDDYGISRESTGIGR